MTEETTPAAEPTPPPSGPAEFAPPAGFAGSVQAPASIPAQYQQQGPYQPPVAGSGPYHVPASAPYQLPAPGYGPSQAEMDQYSAALLQPARDPEAEARRRQRQRNTIRWVGALVLAGAVAAAAGLAVLHPQRTDLPGLATAQDGRYVFPSLSLPTLAPGQPVPGDTADNPGGQHLADIRKLLLPAPQGAVPDKSLPGATGWVPESTMVAMDNASVAEELAQYGLRHTAGVAWKTPDGATTSIYLMQFIDDKAAATAGPVFDSGLNATSGLSASAQAAYTTTGSSAAVTYYTSTSGGKTTRYGYFTEGDTNVLIVFSAPKSVSLIPFEQELQLQSQLLE